MNDYIDRENALDIVAHNNVNGEITLNRYDKIIDGIYEIPSADVAPIRHGHWIEDQDRIVCSECGSRFKDEIIYMQENNPGAPHRCLECGAIMDEEVPTNG